ncbi:hypothetical protein [Vibrio crassostreae]|uniref:hypothetical protein n=1 Tax=Vibrio crassostreae TaxID=246167 RepID=UPI001B308F72|nr:hypothetical protein [Vibrio crassostreae]
MNPILDLTNVQTNSTEVINKDNKNPLDNVNTHEGDGFGDILKKKVEETNQGVEREGAQKETSIRVLDAVSQVVAKDGDVGLPNVSELTQELVGNQPSPATNPNTYLSDEISMCKDLGDQIAQRVFGNKPVNTTDKTDIKSLGKIDVQVQFEPTGAKLNEIDTVDGSKLEFKNSQNVADLKVARETLNFTSETQTASLNGTGDPFADGLKKEFIESLNINIEKTESSKKLEPQKPEKDFTINTNNLKKELNKVLSAEAEKLEIGNRKEIKITVRPSYLGEIKIDMQKNADGMKILIVASNENVSNLLTQHKSDILAEAGRFTGDGDSSGNGESQNDNSSHEQSGTIDKEDELEPIEPELTITSNFTYYN